MSDKVTPIREVVESAEAINPADVVPVAGEPEKKKKKKKFGSFGFPKRCPVVPLGFNANEYYYLDSSKQLRPMKYSDHSRLGLLSLFNKESEFLYDYFGRYDKEGELVGWKPDLVAEVLMAEASRQGVLDVLDRVRGPGAWVDEDDRLILHCGNALYTKDDKIDPGRIGRHIYPSAPDRPAPADKEAGVFHGQMILDLLSSWNWTRPDMDPQLLLGWIAAAMIGGALKWRPMVWVTGDKATGKSTLHDVLKDLLGPGGLISASDASAAGLWQSVGHASLPIALDEIEAEEDNRKNNNIIKLARHAASGGSTLRGGADHKGASFTVRNCFIFSSILIPPLPAQDKSRMAILELKKLEDIHPPKIDHKELAKWGVMLRRRLLNRWDSFPETLELFRHSLAETGHSGRSTDLFGTLLACQHILTSDALPDKGILDHWQAALDHKEIVEDDDIPDHERCIGHLMTSLCDVYRNGERRQIGSWIYQAAGRDKGRLDEQEANRVLANFGLKVCKKAPDNPRLLVANNHQGLAALFKDTHWSGRSGTSGVWPQAFRRIEGSEVVGCIRFDNVASRCTAIPLASILDKNGEG